MPLSQAKELLQDCYSAYLVCYDECKGFKKSEKAFKDFAQKYKK